MIKIKHPDITLAAFNTKELFLEFNKYLTQFIFAYLLELIITTLASFPIVLNTFNYASRSKLLNWFFLFTIFASLHTLKEYLNLRFVSSKEFFSAISFTIINCVNNDIAHSNHLVVFIPDSLPICKVEFK